MLHKRVICTIAENIRNISELLNQFVSLNTDDYGYHKINCAINQRIEELYGNKIKEIDEKAKLIEEKKKLL